MISPKNQQQAYIFAFATNTTTSNAPLLLHLSASFPTHLHHTRVPSAIMKVFSSTHAFDFNWDFVSTANWRKYGPWNHRSEHVLAVDTLSRRIDPSTGILRTERLITCQQTAPAWVIKVLGGCTTSHVHEVSYVDPRAKKVTMSSTNLTWSNLLNVRETVVYTPETRRLRQTETRKAGNKEETGRTIFQQEAKITALCGGWQKIRSKIEEACVERFGENAKNGREGFESVLEMSRRAFGEERERVTMAAEHQ